MALRSLRWIPPKKFRFTYTLFETIFWHFFFFYLSARTDDDASEYYDCSCFRVDGERSDRNSTTKKVGNTTDVIKIRNNLYKKFKYLASLFRSEPFFFFFIPNRIPTTWYIHGWGNERFRRVLKNVYVGFALRQSVLIVYFGTWCCLRPDVLLFEIPREGVGGPPCPKTRITLASRLSLLRRPCRMSVSDNRCRDLSGLLRRRRIWDSPCCCWWISEIWLLGIVSKILNVNLRIL